MIGAGRWGPNILSSIEAISNAKVEMVCDLNQDSLDNLRGRFPQIQITTNINDILNSGVDAVCVATPVCTHFKLGLSVLESGKHLFIEKPLCHTSEEARKLIALAKEKELKIMVGHVFLFNPTIIKVKEILEGGSMGKIYYMESHRTNFGPVREDVNALWDLTSHDISIFNYLLSSEPEAVSANGSRALDGNVEDTTFATFKYPEDILAHSHASWLNPKKVRQITIVGEKKMLIWDDIDLERPIQIFDSNITIEEQGEYCDSFSSHRSVYNRGGISIPHVKTGQPLKLELAHFIECLRNGEEVRSGGDFSAKIVSVLEASDRSLKNDGQFISIES